MKYKYRIKEVTYGDDSVKYYAQFSPKFVNFYINMEDEGQYSKQHAQRIIDLHIEMSNSKEVVKERIVG